MLGRLTVWGFSSAMIGRNGTRQKTGVKIRAFMEYTDHEENQSHPSSGNYLFRGGNRGGDGFGDRLRAEGFFLAG